MFTRVDANKVSSDKGFEVQILQGGCDGLFLAYREQDKTILLDVYSLDVYLHGARSDGSDVPWAIEIPSPLKWDKKDAKGWLTPNAGESLTAADEARVFENIQNVLKFMEQPVKFFEVRNKHRRI